MKQLLLTKNIRHVFKVFFIFCLLVSCVNILPLVFTPEQNVEAAGPAPQWGQVRGMPTRENYKNLSPDNILGSSSSIKWQMHNTGIATPGYTDNSGNTGNIEWQSPYIASDGTIYVIGTHVGGVSTSYLYALDPLTGNQKWNPYQLTIPRNCEQIPVSETTFEAGNTWSINGILPTGDVVVSIAESHSCWDGSTNYPTSTVQVLRITFGPAPVITNSLYLARGNGFNYPYDVGGIYQYSNQDIFYVSIGQYLQKHYTFYTIQKSPASQWQIDVNWFDKCSGSQCPHNDVYTPVVMSSDNMYSYAYDSGSASQSLTTNDQRIGGEISSGTSALVTPVTFNWPSGTETGERMIIGGNTGYILYFKKAGDRVPTNTDIYQESDSLRGQLLGVDKSNNDLITNAPGGYLRKINLNDPSITNYYGTCGPNNLGYGVNPHGIHTNNCNINIPYSRLSLESNELIDAVILPGYIYYTVRVWSGGARTNTVRFYVRKLSDFNNAAVPPTPVFRKDVTAHSFIVHYNEFGGLAVSNSGDVYMSNGNQIVAFAPITTLPWFTAEKSLSFSGRSYQNVITGGNPNNTKPIALVNKRYSDTVISSSAALVNFYSANGSDNVTNFGKVIYRYNDNNAIPSASNVYDDILNQKNGSANTVNLPANSYTIDASTTSNTIYIAPTLPVGGTYTVNYTAASSKNGVIIFVPGNVNINLNGNSDNAASIVIISKGSVSISNPSNVSKTIDLGIIAQGNITYPGGSGFSITQNGFVFAYTGKVTVPFSNPVVDGTTPSLQLKFNGKYMRGSFRNLFTSASDYSQEFVGFQY